MNRNAVGSQETRTGHEVHCPLPGTEHLVKFGADIAPFRPEKWRCCHEELLHHQTYVLRSVYSWLSGQVV